MGHLMGQMARRMGTVQASTDQAMDSLHLGRWPTSSKQPCRRAHTVQHASCSPGTHLCKGVGVAERGRLALQVRHLLLQLKLLAPRVRDLQRTR